MNDQSNELRQMIAGAIAGKSGQTRRRALAACQWRLRGPHGEHVGLAGDGTCAFVSEGEASVFDGCDNEEMKRAFFSAVLKAPLMVEILPQTCAA